MNDMREFLGSVVEYVELTDQLIGSLQKKASAPVPAFSDKALEKTAAALVQAGLLSPRSTEVLVQSFRESPDKVLESLQKVAAQVAPSTRGAEIGAPATRPARRVTGRTDVRESDMQFEKHFGLRSK